MTEKHQKRKYFLDNILENMKNLTVNGANNYGDCYIRGYQGFY